MEAKTIYSKPASACLAENLDAFWKMKKPIPPKNILKPFFDKSVHTVKIT